MFTDTEGRRENEIVFCKTFITGNFVILPFSFCLSVQEIEKAWKLVDIGTEKEERAKETIQRLQDEITELSKLVDDKEVLGEEYR